MIAEVTEGKEVKILTSGGELDPNTYTVKYVKHGLVGLTCKETNITIKVNNQRIYKIINQENVMSNESNTAVIDETTIEAPEFAVSTENQTQVKTEKPKAKRTPKAPPAPIDFDAIVNDGYEVWTKTGLSLGDDPKVSAIQVAAHCVIGNFVNDGDNPVKNIPVGETFEGYEVFNSYNGTRGAKGKGGKRYTFTEKMTREKKRKNLEKKGYIQHTV